MPKVNCPEETCQHNASGSCIKDEITLRSAGDPEQDLSLSLNDEYALLDCTSYEREEDED